MLLKYVFEFNLSNYCYIVFVKVALQSVKHFKKIFTLPASGGGIVTDTVGDQALLIFRQLCHLSNYYTGISLTDIWFTEWHESMKIC